MNLQGDLTPVQIALAKARSKFLPPPKLTVSEWADNYRQLSKEASAEPGQWRTSRTPYLREPMDAFSDPEVNTVVCMFCTQVGKSELVNNVIGYHIHQDPAPMLLIQPTIKAAEDYSKERIEPMLRDTDALAEIFGDKKAKVKSDTISVKAFPGGSLACIGANSPAGLASRPRRLVLGDEVDRYPISAKDEGDPFNLARKRAKTFWNKKFGLVSSPTVKGVSRIADEFELSDQRRFFVVCEHEECQHAQTLKWSNVHWEKDENEKGVAKTAYMACEGCGSTWNDAVINRMVREAESKKDLGGGWVATRSFRGIAGFHLNELYSPWVPLWEIVQDWLDAKQTGKPEKLKTFINTTLAELWDDSKETVKPEDLLARREEYTPDELPGMEHGSLGPLLITGGVDLQDDRLELGVYAWGLGEECWTVEQLVFTGNPADMSVNGPWHELLQHILTTVYYTADGLGLKIEAACVDTGGHFTTEAYQFCRENKRYRIFAIAGRSGMGKPIWPEKSSRAKKVRVELYHLGVDQGKNTIFTRLRRLAAPGPGYIHFPSNVDQEHFDQLTAEKKVTETRPNGQKVDVWKPTRERNEVLDCFVYAYAALWARDPKKKKNPDKYLILRGKQLAKKRNIEMPDPNAVKPDDTEKAPDEKEAAPPEEKPKKKRIVRKSKAPARPSKNRRRGGFAQNW